MSSQISTENNNKDIFIQWVTNLGRARTDKRNYFPFPKRLKRLLWLL